MPSANVDIAETSPVLAAATRRWQYQHERTTWALDYLPERGHTLPRPSADLFSCGRSDNGDVTYWIIAGNDGPEQWRIGLDESRGHLWDEFGGRLGEWLEAVLSRIRMKILPKDLPAERSASPRSPDSAAAAVRIELRETDMRRRGYRRAAPRGALFCRGQRAA